MRMNAHEQSARTAIHAQILVEPWFRLHKGVLDGAGCG